MKTNTIAFLLIFFTCNVLLGQPPSLDHSFNDYTVAVNKIISRAITAHKLYQLNVPDPNCWGGPKSLRSAYGFENCTPPYTLCTSRYCPDDYWGFIEKAADLNASMFYRAASTLFVEGSFADIPINVKSNDIIEEYALAMSQLVNDINSVYTQKGLRNPVVQGTCFERVTKDVNAVRIPRYIINEFVEYMTPEEKDYYDNPITNPIPIYFDRDRIYNCPLDPEDCSSHYDITSIEAQMWMYHVCKKYIDWGYTAIHMGIYYSYSRNDTGFVITERLYTMIRDYAESVNSFVLLNGEGGHREAIGPSGRRLFDFDGLALRAKEIADNYTDINGDSNPCEDSMIDPVLAAFFDSGDCANELQPAIVDQCRVGASSISQETAWNGFYHKFGIPYTIYFDWASGERIKKDEDNNTICLPEPPPNEHCFKADFDPNNIIGEPSQETVWGVDDVNWFAYLLDNEDEEDEHTLLAGENSDKCKGAWWKFSYSQIREFEDKFGFLQAMGLHSVNRPSLHCNIAFNNYLNQMNPEPPYDEYKPITNYWFRIMNYEETYNKYSEAWSVTPIEFEMTQQFNGGLSCCDNGWTEKEGKYLYSNTVKVLNPDPSSTYSIHIFNVRTQQWLPYTIGTERTFVIDEPIESFLRVIVRADNWIAEYGSSGFDQKIQHWFLKSGECTTLVKCRDNKSKDNDVKLTPYLNMEDKANSSLKKYYDSLEKIEYASHASDFSMKVYPNPTSKNKDFKLSLSKNINDNDILKIYSIDGTTLTSSFEINKSTKKDFLIRCANDISSGIYIISYYNSELKVFVNQKLIIE